MRSSRVRASLMTLSLISLVCFLLITSQMSYLCQPGGQQSRAWPTPTAGNSAFVTVHVDSSRIARAIPADFAGFSLDLAFLCQLLAVEKTDPTLYRLYDNLDPTVLRVGGASADRAAWTPEQACSEAHIGRSVLDDLFALARRLNAHVIWTVNLRAGDPRAAAQEAAYAIDMGGSTLSGIEIG